MCFTNTDIQGYSKIISELFLFFFLSENVIAVGHTAPVLKRKKLDVDCRYGGKANFDNGSTLMTCIMCGLV